MIKKKQTWAMFYTLPTHRIPHSLWPIHRTASNSMPFAISNQYRVWFDVASLRGPEQLSECWLAIGMLDAWFNVRDSVWTMNGVHRVPMRIFILFAKIQWVPYEATVSSVLYYNVLCFHVCWTLTMYAEYRSSLDVVLISKFSMHFSSGECFNPDDKAIQATAVIARIGKQKYHFGKT